MEELQRITERLNALTRGNPAAPLLQGPKAAPLPTQGPRLPVRATNNAVLRRAQGPVPSSNIPGVGSTKTVLNAPGKGSSMNPLSPGNLLREGAITLGITGARALADSAGTPGQSRMSGLGLMGPAPVYQTPLNNVTASQVAADKAKREGQTALERITGDLSGKIRKEEPLPSTYNVMGVDYDSATGQAINPGTKKISSGGYAIVPGSNKRIDYKKGEDRLNSLGTDTTTSLREDPRNTDYVQQRDTLTADSTAAERSSVQDAGMVAWAQANPELAARMVAKQDRRLETNPGFKQSGYEAVRNELYPERAVLAAEGNLGGFSARDAVGGGMSAQNAINIASGGSVETLIDGDKATQVSSAPGKAKALVESYKKSIIDAPAEGLPPSVTQNPSPVGGDGTPIDSEFELANKAYARAKFVTDPATGQLMEVK